MPVSVKSILLAPGTFTSLLFLKPSNRCLVDASSSSRLQFGYWFTRFGSEAAEKLKWKSSVSSSSYCDSTCDSHVASKRCIRCMGESAAGVPAGSPSTGVTGFVVLSPPPQPARRSTRGRANAKRIESSNYNRYRALRLPQDVEDAGLITGHLPPARGCVRSSQRRRYQCVASAPEITAASPRTT